MTEARAQAFDSRVEDGQGYEIDPDNWQRRTLALIDVDAERFYCLDFYRVFGGADHWWSFHAQEDEGFATSGIDLVKQPTGTLAGPDVPYGDPEWLRKNAQYHDAYGFRDPISAFRISTTSAAGIRGARGRPIGR